MTARAGRRVTVIVNGTALLLGLPLAAQNFTTSTSFCADAGHTASVALGDLDGDGDLDAIFGAGRHEPEASWAYYNDGKGNFLGRRALGDERGRTYRAELGDMDGDGDLDVVTANDIGEWGRIYFNDGRGVFFRSATYGSNAYAARDVELADLDGDRDLDIIVASTIFGQSMLYFNDGAGKFTGRPLGADRQLTLALAVGDLDADGDRDIVAGSRGGPTVAFLNDGAGNFPRTSTIGTGKDLTVAVAAGDLDGDGDLDLVTGNWDARPQVHLNDSKGAFTPFGVIEPASQTYAVALGDLDLDGDLDIVVGNWGPRTSRADADGDGIMERWIEVTGEERSRVYLNDGRAQFSRSYAFGVGNDRIRSLALGDVDKDGDLDIMTGSDCQINKVFYNSVQR